MSSQLILLGCYAFAFWAYLWDRRNYPAASAGLWLPTLWMLRCGSRSIDNWISGAGDRLDPVLLALLTCGGFLVLMQRPCDWGGIFAHNSALFVFYGYLACSVLWADALENPLIKIVRPIGDLIMALVIATDPKPHDAIITTARRTAILLIPLSIVLIRYFPHLGRGIAKHWEGDPWIGVTTHKNPLGQLAMVSALSFGWCLAYARQQGRRLLGQWVILFYLGMTLYLFNAGGHSRSATSAFCTALAAGLFLLFGFMRDRPQMVVRRIMLGIAALAILSLTLDFFGTSLQAVVAGAQGKDANLTGRTWLWADVVRIGMTEHPVLGSGYGAFWVPSIYAKLSPEVDNRPAEAHNGYLETFANLGIVGLLLLLWIIFSSLGSATKTIQADFEYGRLRLVMLFMVIVLNYSEAAFPRGTHLWWYGFLIFAVYARPWVYWPQFQDIDTDEEYTDTPEQEEALT